jgi:hypothetical protein
MRELRSIERGGGGDIERREGKREGGERGG